jgi:vacuolar-type H+-ATPase subunit F/Vma7
MTRLGVHVICRPELAPGFLLAGIVPIEADDQDEVEAQLTSAKGSETVGVILVQEDLLREGGERSRAAALPMVVPFPGPKTLEAMESPAAYVAEILRRAIGYRVRLE